MVQKILKKGETKENREAAVQPDPETLHKTDPQENMTGPISSLVHKVEETMNENDQDKDPKKKED